MQMFQLKSYVILSFAKCILLWNLKLTRRCSNVIHSQWCNLRFGCRPVTKTKGILILIFIKCHSVVIQCHVIYLVFLWLMVSFLFIHKFDIEAGSGDRCNSFRSPEYLSKKNENEIRFSIRPIFFNLVGIYRFSLDHHIWA